jgi:hypothetical protein
MQRLQLADIDEIEYLILWSPAAIGRIQRKQKDLKQKTKFQFETWRELKQINRNNCSAIRPIAHIVFGILQSRHPQETSCLEL